MKASGFKIGSQEIATNALTRVLIDRSVSSYGYGIYLSAKDFNSATPLINKVFTNFRDQVTMEGVCSVITGVC